MTCLEDELPAAAATGLQVDEGTHLFRPHVLKEDNNYPRTANLHIIIFENLAWIVISSLPEANAENRTTAIKMFKFIKMLRILNFLRYPHTHLSDEAVRAG